MKCKECKFLLIEQDAGSTRFECRRQAPRPIRYLSAEGRFTKFTDAIYGWPTVSPDDWCGEFQEWPKAEAPHEKA